jgi:phage/plasmid-associated DNA primase
MAYLVALHKEGKGLTKLAPPKEVEKYTNEYKEESDAIARFMGEFMHKNDENTVTNPDEGYERVSWTEIAATFKEWKKQNEVQVGVPELRKRVVETYGKLPAGGWTNFRFGTL